MKRSIIFIIALLAFSCKSERKPQSARASQELTILDSIAFAHGFEQWKEVSQIQYTFNVDRDSNHFERSWTWKPQQNAITLVSGNDTLSYTRTIPLDSAYIQADQGFINDKYWLLAPFNLVWDRDSFSYTHQKESKAPISGENMQQLTIVYKNEGGYTPGDAYDFYFNDDLIIREWAFREANANEAGLITTWEDHIETQGIKIAKTHRRDTGNWTLYFDDISIQPKN